MAATLYSSDGNTRIIQLWDTLAAAATDNVVVGLDLLPSGLWRLAMVMRTNASNVGSPPTVGTITPFCDPLQRTLASTVFTLIDNQTGAVVAPNNTVVTINATGFTGRYAQIVNISGTTVNGIYSPCSIPFGLQATTTKGSAATGDPWEVFLLCSRLDGRGFAPTVT